MKLLYSKAIVADRKARLVQAISTLKLDGSEAAARGDRLLRRPRGAELCGGQTQACE